MQANLTILGHAITLECSEAESRRLEDLARALNERLEGSSAEPDATRRLVFTALALMDETQAVHAALARARCEIERLTDLVVEAQLDAETGAPDSAERGRVNSLRRVAEGAA
jgi:cell division protein ZapA (FtsZ GTPase activity inhibitor)